MLPELSGSTSHRSCRTVLRVLQLYLKVAIFQPELHPRALKSCDFCLEKLPRTRPGSTPRPRDSERSRANHATTSKHHFASNKFARRHSESASTRTIRGGSREHIQNQKTCSFCTSTTPIPAEGSSWNVKIAQNPLFDLDHTNLRKGSLAQIKKNPVFDLDHTNLRRGSLAQIRSRKKSPRPHESLQRVARAPEKS